MLIFFPAQAHSKNELALGDAARDTSEVRVEPNLTQCLNFKSKEEVLGLRKQLAEKYRQLLNLPYQPSDEIFAKIENGKPWWGLHGESVFGKGDKSIEGPSEESRFILNPFLLVGANPYTAKIWNGDRLSEADLNDDQFPHTWLPESITWWPKQALAEVVYDVSKFNQELFLRREKMGRESIRNFFALVAYNARDFGYEYLYVVPEKSVNIANTWSKAKAAKIKQFIHCGDSCGYPGNCNNMSPRNDPLDRIKYSGLPASAYIALWKKKPKNTGAIPDMSFQIQLK